jgi:predicted transcriptional regulator
MTKRKSSMKISEVMQILDAVSYCSGELLENEVHSACGSDMMSDVLAFVKDQAMLVTGLVNAQAIRTADMMDMCCVVLVRGKKPTEEMCALAGELGISLLSTDYPMYQACGRLYEAGLGR